MKLRLIIALALIGTLLKAQEILNIESPDTKGTANLDLLHLTKEDNEMIAVWLQRPAALVMGHDEIEKFGKVFKKNGECTGLSYNFGGKVISECDGDKSIANATSIYLVIKQKLSPDGKSKGIKSTTPIAIRYFKKDSTYFAAFKDPNEFVSEQKLKLNYNLASLSAIKELSDSEKDILTKLFIQQYEFINNLPSTAPPDPYEKMVKDFMDFKEATSSWPNIPENHAFKKMYEIGKKKYMLSRDKRYKNEKGSVFYVVDITAPKNPVIVDSTFSPDEASLDKNLMVVNDKMQPCGMLFSYTLEKIQDGKDKEYSRQVIYVGGDNKVLKANFKTGHSKGGANSACDIKYAFKFNDSIFFESDRFRKKMPTQIESFVLTGSGISKITPKDTSKPFLKEKMVRLGSGAVQNMFAQGDDYIVPINLYRSSNKTIVFYQAKEILPQQATGGAETVKDFGIPSISVFQNMELVSTARFYYPYVSNEPIRTSMAYKSDKATYFVMSFNGPNAIIKVDETNGQITDVSNLDPSNLFYYYKPLNKTFLSKYESELFLVQKSNKGKFRLIKVE